MAGIRLFKEIANNVFLYMDKRGDEAVDEDMYEMWQAGKG